MAVVDEGTRERIDSELASWRQGDCAVGDDHWFLFRLEVASPLTPDAQAAAEQGVDAGESPVRGFMVTSQTCDIVRDCATRPYIEVCALVEVPAELMHEVQRGLRPRYAYVPGLAGEHLVADLDRAMTVEKAVVAGWERRIGCRDDDEARRMALTLSRKRVRFAFPDDFTNLLSSLQKRMSSKHDKGSPEGRAIRSLREIRVRAAPSWDSANVSVTFYFIRHEEALDFENVGWHVYLTEWLNRVQPSGRFGAVDGYVTTLADLTALDYVESDALDLDHLSNRGSK